MHWSICCVYVLTHESHNWWHSCSSGQSWPCQSNLLQMVCGCNDMWMHSYVAICTSTIGMIKSLNLSNVSKPWEAAYSNAAAAALQIKDLPYTRSWSSNSDWRQVVGLSPMLSMSSTAIVSTNAHQSRPLQLIWCDSCTCHQLRVRKWGDVTDPHQGLEVSKQRMYSWNLYALFWKCKTPCPMQFC